MNHHCQGLELPQSHLQAVYDQFCGYPYDERTRTYAMAYNSAGNPFSPGTANYYPPLESGSSTHGNMGHMVDEVKRIDPKLLVVLEYFSNLCVEKREMIRKIFPGLHDEFVELLKRIGGEAKTNSPPPPPHHHHHHHHHHRERVQTYQRSLSLGSPQLAAGNQGEFKFKESPRLRLERFKVRIIDVGGSVQQDGQGCEGGNKSG